MAEPRLHFEQYDLEVAGVLYDVCTATHYANRTAKTYSLPVPPPVIM